MRQMLVTENAVGKEIASPIYNRAGEVAFPSATKVTEEIFAHLREAGYAAICVNDPSVGDLRITPFIPEPTLLFAARSLESLITSSRNDPTGTAAAAALANLSQAGIQMAHAALEAATDPVLNGLAFLPGMPYEIAHALGTAQFALVLGKGRCTANDLQYLAQAALLADASCLIRANNATHPGPMEDVQDKDHVEQSFAFVQRNGRFSARVAAAIAAHHEHWNGSGYPDGLKGQDIFLNARLLRVAECYHALVSHPTQSVPPHQAIEFIMGFSGEFFDPSLVQPFVREAPIYAKGLTVQLSTGDIAVITSPNWGHIVRPKVRLVADSHGQRLEHPQDVDLSLAEHQHVLLAGLSPW